MSRTIDGRTVEFRTCTTPLELVNEFDVLEMVTEATVHTSHKGGSAIDSERHKDVHRANLNN